MTISLYLRDLIKTALQCGSKNYSVYPNNAKEEATYPYCVFRESVYAMNDVVTEGTIEIDLWDEHDTYSRIQTMMDDINDALENLIADDGHCQVRAYRGSFRIVEDSDKRIKHMNGSADIRFIKRKEITNG